MITRVTLGYDEVDPADLTGEGVAWAQLVPGDVDDRIAEFVREQLPATGWRELAIESPSGRRVFAAPHKGGWALAHLLATPGVDILSADTGPFAPRPGKAARRAGLAMALDSSMSSVDGVFATLTNTSGKPWVADLRDSGYCHAWLLDASGARLGSSAFVYASPQHQLKDLLPGESLRLPVQLEGSRTLAPGRHQLEVVMPSVDLFITGTIEVR